MAVLAKNAHKPFYVAVESYKFVRDFPLSQLDITTSLEATVYHLDGSTAPPTAPPTAPGSPDLGHGATPGVQVGWAARALATQRSPYG